MPGTLGFFPKLRWKLEAQDQVYVCVWGGSISMIASHHRHSMVNCVLLSLFYTQHNGSLGNSGQWGYRIWLWKWPHGTTLPSYDTKTSQGTSLRVGFWLSNKCKLKVIGWVWLKGSYKPSLPGIAQRLWDGPWVGGEEELLLQTMALGHSSKHTYNLPWKKIFGAEHSNLFLKNYLRLHLA